MQVQFTVGKRYLDPLLKYINEAFALSCLPDIQERKLFPNAKEWTESMATYNAVRKCLKRFALNDSRVSLVSVGDGHTPRTAALFAFRTAWQCYSIDPNVAVRDYKIQRLSVYRKRIENIPPWNFLGPLVIVAVHSHASLQEAVNRLRSETDRAVVAMPCCYKQEIDERKPDVSYKDAGIWSPHNLIKIWEKV